jgi:hypothetical protein
MSCGSTITTKNSSKKKGYTKPTMTTPKDKKTTWTQSLKHKFSFPFWPRGV